MAKTCFVRCHFLLQGVHSPTCRRTTEDWRPFARLDRTNRGCARASVVSAWVTMPGLHTSDSTATQKAEANGVRKTGDTPGVKSHCPRQAPRKRWPLNPRDHAQTGSCGYESEMIAGCWAAHQRHQKLNAAVLATAETHGAWTSLAANMAQQARETTILVSALRTWRPRVADNAATHRCSLGVNC